MDWEDAMQEGRLMFCTLLDRFRRNKFTIETPQHMMTLYKTSLARHFHTLSNRDTKRKVEIPMSDYDTDDSSDLVIEYYMDNPHNDDYKMIEFFDSIDKSPPHIRQIFTLLTNSNDTIADMILSLISCNKLQRGQCNEQLCQMIGVDSKKINVIDNLEWYLRHFNDLEDQN